WLTSTSFDLPGDHSSPSTPSPPSVTRRASPPRLPHVHPAPGASLALRRLHARPPGHELYRPSRLQDGALPADRGAENGAPSPPASSAIGRSTYIASWRCACTTALPHPSPVQASSSGNSARRNNSGGAVTSP